MLRYSNTLLLRSRNYIFVGLAKPARFGCDNSLERVIPESLLQGVYNPPTSFSIRNALSNSDSNSASLFNCTLNLGRNMLIDNVNEYMILVRLDRTAARGDIEMESGSNARLSVCRCRIRVCQRVSDAE